MGPIGNKGGAAARRKLELRHTPGGGEHRSADVVDDRTTKEKRLASVAARALLLGSGYPDTASGVPLLCSVNSNHHNEFLCTLLRAAFGRLFLFFGSNSYNP
jgi:hypothetical protein